MAGLFDLLSALRERQRVPAANALEYQNFKEMYGREPRQGEVQTELISPMSYLAGQVAGTNVAGGAPGPRFGSLNADDAAMMRLMKSGPKTPSGAGSLTGLPAERSWVGVKPATAVEGTAPRVVPQSYTNPKQFEMPSQFQNLSSEPPSPLTSAIRDIPAPPVDLNDPIHLKNADLLRRLGLIQ
jgi:hypothetical protein